MAQYSKNKKNAAPSDKVIVDAQKLAKANQRPSQTKEQTKLVAQGIQKGIEQYKKQQKEKARDLDKKIKKVNRQLDSEPAQENIEIQESAPKKSNTLPWVLLGISWLGFVGFTYFSYLLIIGSLA